MTVEPRHASASEVSPVEPWPGAHRRTLVWGERMLLAEISLREGVVVPSHRHSHEQTGYVVSGRLEFTVEGEKLILGARGSYLIPVGAEHSVRALADSVAIDVFSPILAEFITPAAGWPERQADTPGPSAALGAGPGGDDPSSRPGGRA